MSDSLEADGIGEKHTWIRTLPHFEGATLTVVIALSPGFFRNLISAVLKAGSSPVSRTPTSLRGHCVFFFGLPPRQECMAMGG